MIVKELAKTDKLIYPKKSMIGFIKTKIVSVLIVIAFCITVPSNLRAELDSRVKAVLMMAGYGTVGGGLLGISSALAFETGWRSPFIGMSLGLYAGLLFGGYVVAGHAMKSRNWNSEEAEDEYYPSGGGSTDGSGAAGAGYYQRMDPTMGTRSCMAFNHDCFARSKPKATMPPVYLNFFTYRF